MRTSPTLLHLDLMDLSVAILAARATDLRLKFASWNSAFQRSLEGVHRGSQDLWRTNRSDAYNKSLTLDLILTILGVEGAPVLKSYDVVESSLILLVIRIYKSMCDI